MLAVVAGVKGGVADVGNGEATDVEVGGTNGGVVGVGT